MSEIADGSSGSSGIRGTVVEEGNATAMTRMVNVPKRVSKAGDINIVSTSKR
jgi:hypothetical protein